MATFFSQKIHVFEYSLHILTQFIGKSFIDKWDEQKMVIICKRLIITSLMMWKVNILNKLKGSKKFKSSYIYHIINFIKNLHPNKHPKTERKYYENLSLFWITLIINLLITFKYFYWQLKLRKLAWEKSITSIKACIKSINMIIKICEL